MDTFNIDIIQGQTFTMSLTLRDINGVPINLGGYAISGYLKTRYSDTTKLADLNVTVADAVNGIVNLYVSATGTMALPINIALYDIEMLNSGDGSVTKVLAGGAAVYPEITY